MLLTGSVTDVSTMTNQQRQRNISVSYQKRDTSVTKLQKGTYRTSLILDNVGHTNSGSREHKWSSLRLPKETEKSAAFGGVKKTLSANGGIEFYSAPSELQTQTPATKEV